MTTADPIAALESQLHIRTLQVSLKSADATDRALDALMALCTSTSDPVELRHVCIAIARLSARTRAAAPSAPPKPPAPRPDPQGRAHAAQAIREAEQLLAIMRQSPGAPAPGTHRSVQPPPAPTTTANPPHTSERTSPPQPFSSQAPTPPAAPASSTPTAPTSTPAEPFNAPTPTQSPAPPPTAPILAGASPSRAREPPLCISAASGSAISAYSLSRLVSLGDPCPPAPIRLVGINAIGGGQLLGVRIAERRRLIDNHLRGP